MAPGMSRRLKTCVDHDLAQGRASPAMEECSRGFRTQSHELVGMSAYPEISLATDHLHPPSSHTITTAMARAAQRTSHSTPAYSPVRATQERMRARLAALPSRQASPSTARGEGAPDTTTSSLANGVAASSSVDAPPSSDGPAPTLRRTRTPDLEEWGALLKRQKNFSTEAEAELDVFCRVRDDPCTLHVVLTGLPQRGHDAHDRQTAMLFSLLLGVDQKLQSLMSDKAFMINPTLKVSIPIFILHVEN